MKTGDPFSFGFTDLVQEGLWDRIVDGTVGNKPIDDDLRNQHQACLDNEYKGWHVRHTDDGDGAIFSKITSPDGKETRMLKSFKKGNGTVKHQYTKDY